MANNTGKPPVPPVNPWDRQVGETLGGYEFFLTYIRMGPDERSISKVARHHNRKESYLRALSARVGWVARARAYDLHMEASTRKKLVKEIENAATRKARQLARMDETLIDTCWETFLQARRRLKRTKAAERQALLDKAAGKKAELPRTEEWKAIETSMTVVIPMADLAMARTRAALQDDGGEGGPGQVDTEAAAAALRAVAQTRGLAGPDGPAEESGDSQC